MTVRMSFGGPVVGCECFRVERNTADLSTLSCSPHTTLSLTKRHRDAAARPHGDENKLAFV